MLFSPRRRFVHVLVTLGLALAVSTGTGATAAKDQPVDLSLKPVGQDGSYFDLSMTPGETQQLEVTLGNNGPTDLDVSTYAADAYSIINGGFGAEERGSEPSGVTTWLSYEDEVLSLPAGQQATRPVTITVPADTEPGEYVSSIIMENDVPIKGTGSVALDQIVRHALPVAITVPGPLEPAFEFTEAGHKFTTGDSVVSVGITNTGNAHVQPEGDLTIRDDDGETVSETSVTMQSVYAGTETLVETTLDGSLNPGKYTLSVSMTDPESGVTATAEDLPFTVEKAEKGVTSGEQQDGRSGITQDSGPGVLLYIAIAAVLVLLVVVYLLIRNQRRLND